MKEIVVIRGGDFAGASAEVIRRTKKLVYLKATKAYGDEYDDAYLTIGEKFTCLPSECPVDNEMIEEEINEAVYTLRGLLLKRRCKNGKPISDEEVMKILRGV